MINDSCVSSFKSDTGMQAFTNPKRGQPGARPTVPMCFQLCLRLHIRRKKFNTTETTFNWLESLAHGDHAFFDTASTAKTKIAGNTRALLAPAKPSLTHIRTSKALL